MSLITMLPFFYDNNITRTIQDSMGIESDILKEEIEDTLNQLFIETATWGLDYWEKMLGINRNNFNYQTRRENIKAKMRSRGTTTISVVKNICESYSNGIVDIKVFSSEYRFEIHFIGSIGIPQAFAELDKTIEEIKPCHLAHSYKFYYNTHADLSKFTHEQLSNYTHEELRNSQELRGDK